MISYSKRTIGVRISEMLLYIFSESFTEYQKRYHNHPVAEVDPEDILVRKQTYSNILKILPPKMKIFR